MNQLISFKVYAQMHSITLLYSIVHVNVNANAIIDKNLISAPYHRFLNENVGPSVCELNLKLSWVIQKDNDSKHTSSSIPEWLERSTFEVLD